MRSGREEESEKLRSESSFSDTQSFHSQYIVLNTIGHGSCATVKLAQHRLTGTHVAVKMIPKRKHWIHPITSEVEIMMKVNHPNIISLLQVIETEKNIYLIMDLVKGKSLYQYIHHAGPLQEHEARAIFKQLLSAISYCHDQGIVHRDLKPGNIMIDRNGTIKIIDFGLSTQVKPGQQLSYHCGTYPYAAPEILLARPYDGSKVDVWTLGIVLYFMIAGRPPFDAVNVPELRQQIMSGQYPVPSGLSIELEDLISLLITANPKHRLTVAEIMMHPWVTDDSECFTDPCQEPFPLRPDPAILKAMGHIGFPAQDVKDALSQCRYNQAMATYLFLKRQALQECDSPNRAQPMNPLMTPFPSMDDPVSFAVGLRRRESEPTLLWSSSMSEASASGQKTIIQRRQQRVSWTGIPLCRPVQTTPTMGQDHLYSRSVPCMYSMHYGDLRSSSNVGSEKNPRASAKDKPAPNRGRFRGFKKWTQRLRNTMRRLCCCIPSPKKPPPGQKRVSPQI